MNKSKMDLTWQQTQEAIKELQQEQGLNQSEIATMAGVNQGAVSKFLSDTGPKGTKTTLVFEWYAAMSFEVRLQARVQCYINTLNRGQRSLIKQDLCQHCGYSTSGLNKWLRGASISQKTTAAKILDWWETVDPDPEVLFKLLTLPTIEEVPTSPQEYPEESPELWGDDTPIDLIPAETQERPQISFDFEVCDNVTHISAARQHTVQQDEHYDPDLDHDPLLARIAALDVSGVLAAIRIEQQRISKNQTDQDQKLADLEKQLGNLALMILEIAPSPDEAPDIPKDKLIVMWVRGYATHKGQDFRQTWIDLYTKFQYTPGGFNVGVRQTPGMSKLDVIKACGKLDLLYAVARRYFRLEGVANEKRSGKQNHQGY